MKPNKFLIILIGVSVLLGIFFSGIFIATGYSPRVFAGKIVRKLGINKVERSSAEMALNKYLEAWENVDPQEMYLYISYYDRENLPQQEYIEQFLEYPIRPLGHKIKNITQDSNSAKALVEVSWPDFTSADSIKRDEIFYLVLEGSTWKIREAASFVK